MAIPDAGSPAGGTEPGLQTVWHFFSLGATLLDLVVLFTWRYYGLEFQVQQHLGRIIRGQVQLRTLLAFRRVEHSRNA